MPTIRAFSIAPTSVSNELFGGNLLSTRDSLGDDSTFEVVADQLDISEFRYPGGSLTENYFDIGNPNADSVTHTNGVDTVGLVPLSDFFFFLEKNGFSTTLVIPTRGYLSENRDQNGHRFASIDREELQTFVRDVLDGEYGHVSIDAFEIGNEYWGSGEMSAVEYGRVSKEVVSIISDSLQSHPDHETLFSTTDILVQMGTNYGEHSLSSDFEDVEDGAAQLDAFNEAYNTDFGNDFLYSSGSVKWAHLANELIIREHEDAGTLEKIDGIVAHVYSRGADLASSRYYALRTVEQTWSERLEEVELHVTEWNQTNRLDHDEEFGLMQAHEMLNLMEAFVEFEVDAAHVWPLQQNTANDLSGDVGQTDLTVAGEMFSLMSDCLIGTRPINLNGNPRQPEDEIETQSADIHGFYAEDRLVIVVASTRSEETDILLDLGELITDESSATAHILGVVDGHNPTGSDAIAETNEVSQSSFYQEQYVDLSLDPYEIAWIEVVNPTYTDNLLNLIEGDAPDPVPPDWDDDDDGAPLPPYLPIPDGDVEEDEEEDELASDDIELGGGMGLGFLLLALLGAAAGFGGG